MDFVPTRFVRDVGKVAIIGGEDAPDLFVGRIENCLCRLASTDDASDYQIYGFRREGDPLAVIGPGAREDVPDALHQNRTLRRLHGFQPVSPLDAENALGSIGAR